MSEEAMDRSREGWSQLEVTPSWRSSQPVYVAIRDAVEELIAERRGESRRWVTDVLVDRIVRDAETCGSEELADALHAWLEAIGSGRDGGGKDERGWVRAAALDRVERELNKV